MRSLALVSLCAVFLGAALPSDRATPARLGGEARYLTFVSTDKPLYKPGETVFVRGVLLHAEKHTPLPQQVQATFEIKGPRGELILTGASATIDSVSGFSWQVSDEAAGGQYQVRVSYPWQGYPPAERKFEVRAYRAPRLKTQIKFARDGYGPGDTIAATLEVSRAEGGIPTGAKVTATARVDEKDVASVVTNVDAMGLVNVQLPLPKAIERGEGTLSFVIEDGGVQETAGKTIPILLQAVDVALFPEGGRLIAGLPTRVYFEAKTPAQKPADLSGVVIDGRGNTVAEFRSEHEGRGRFSFIPRKGEQYRFKVTQPASVKTSVPLAIENEGGVLQSEADVFGRGEKVRLTATWTGDRTARLVLSQKGRVLDTVKQAPNGKPVALDPHDADGVLVATLYAGELPLAERLVFREQAKLLQIELKADKARYVPGQFASVTVRTTVGGKPVSGIVGLTVTDDSIEEMIERREQAPTLPVMVLLEQEVQDLADAQVYLSSTEPKAKRATDLLLGTQGWRRFAFENVAAFLEKGDPARRVLAMLTPQPPPVDFEDDGMLIGGMDAVAEVAAAAPPQVQRAPQRPAPVKPMPLQRKAIVDVVRAPAAPVAMKAPPRNDQAKERREAAGKQHANKRELVAPMEMPVHGGDMPWQPPQAYVVVREFAHQVRPGRKADDRTDFAETLYWSAGVRTDAKTGEAKIQFGLSDAVSSFRVRAGAFSADGAFGSSDLKLESVKAFYVEPKLPLEVTAGDVISLPISLVNGSKERLEGVSLALEGRGDLRFTQPANLSLAADERARRIVELAIGAGTTSTELKIWAKGGGYEDFVTRPLSVKPRGFPSELSFAGQLKPNGTLEHAFELPKDTVAGSVTTRIAVYPSPLANMTEALKRMIQEPSGCFEQTSSTTYPMTMAMQYFGSHSGVDPALQKDAADKLDRGYQRLTGYECKEKGFEWFGEDPGHEALTAYGLLHFTDMSKVRSVDGEMLSRSKAWLLKQRDGKGGFERKRRALHTWVEDKDSSDAYITWALLEAGATGLDAERAHVKQIGRTAKNSYAVALAANVARVGNDKEELRALADKLAALQNEQGIVKGATQSIVGSQGLDLEIETTALAAMAWMKSPPHQPNVERSMKFLAESCQGGRYGSTQATVLALKVIVEYDKLRSGGRKAGKVQLFVDGKPFGAAHGFDGNTQGALTLGDAGELLAAGRHTLALKTEGGSEIPYSVSVRFHRVSPESAADAKVAIDVRLPSQKLKEGEVIEAIVRVENVTGEALPTVVAIVGLPGGLEPRHDQLKELVKSKQLDAYEVMGRDVVLYWRGMTARQQRRVPVSLIAAVPGKYVGPASRGYLYYADAKKVWQPGLVAEISAR